MGEMPHCYAESDLLASELSAKMSFAKDGQLE
jgi:hypothetical protein